MSDAKPSIPGRLPVDPFAWRTVPLSFGVLVVTWVLLIAWLHGGSSGAGNVFAAWVCIVAVLYTVSALAQPKRLWRGAPTWLRLFFRIGSLGQILVLAWFGCWWLFALSSWTLLVAMAWRQRIDDLIAVQAAEQSA